MIDDAQVSATARALSMALEPTIGAVYFSPECHAAYEKLGFNPSPATTAGVALPDGPAYFTSRGSVMGQVPGHVVAAAFAVFNPAIVAPAVSYGWTLTDARTICDARTDGAVAQLARVLGDEPDGIQRAIELLRRGSSRLQPAGRPLFAGLLSLDEPAAPLGALFRLGDRLREYRGDSHTVAWVGRGFDAVEIGLLTELYWGLPLRTYVRSRAWSEQDLDDATARLEARGLIEGGAFTELGVQTREEIEQATDRQLRPLVEELGDDADELIELLGRWSAAVRDAGGYFPAGPADLAQAAAARQNATPSSSA